MDPQTTTPAGAGVGWFGEAVYLGLGVHAIDFLQAGSLAAESADVEELGAADAITTDLVDAINYLRVEGEDALDALAEAHLADGEGALCALVDGDNEAFKRLQTLLVAFLDLDLDANLVAWEKLGEIGALQLVSEALHYWMN